jgi:putative transposase
MLIKGDEQEDFLRRVVTAKAHEMDAWIDGFGTWEDHVHMVVRTSPVLSVEKFIHDIKGVAAWLWNKEKAEKWGFLKWQDGYWVVSISPDSLKPIIEYANSQRTHHSSGSLQKAWEPLP